MTARPGTARFVVDQVGGNVGVLSETSASTADDVRQVREVLGRLDAAVVGALGRE